MKASASDGHVVVWEDTARGPEVVAEVFRAVAGGKEGCWGVED